MYLFFALFLGVFVVKQFATLFSGGGDIIRDIGFYFKGQSALSDRLTKKNVDRRR